ncbi:MAG: nucleotidyltransferase family protein [Rhodospirillaceae bacterium]|jgi:hypothetical protein|nr:nucleotidyltransferase family protein [Rhodospirillaceae bacterium]MBT4042083.1 nucleotidyltransferase family protein [Rhodospirillaceae bacterium]MBT4688289.1 nucleotidyltransferase family protein [Rhodospirillaceae bacterium]MBT5079282.1 nucleotidyltransferase family protein [Rhodospirillaceae bacterium]MBT5525746.1 nucleotidyltransferase family protein [Rhodospirillaceae bacterium]
MRNEADVLALIAADPWMMAALAAARQLDLADCWIGAGFIRAKVWDHLHGYDQATALDDVDLLYFQADDITRESEQALQARLCRALPGPCWSVKNQARMHLRNGDRSYTSTTDAMRFWLETPTCVAVRLRGDGELELTAPYGIEDLLAMIIRPTPIGQRRMAAFKDRLARKNWLQSWPQVRVIWSP